MDNDLSTLGYEPKKCPKCGELMKFKGLGEYVCEECAIREYDVYGKVRNYIETHKGCNAIEVERATGVPQKAIRQMLREERIEVAKDSKIFLKCERCGKDILSGRYCEACTRLLHGISEKRPEKKSNARGYGMSTNASLDGEIRFKKMK